MEGPDRAVPVVDGRGVSRFGHVVAGGTHTLILDHELLDELHVSSLHMSNVGEVSASILAGVSAQDEGVEDNVHSAGIRAAIRSERLRGLVELGICTGRGGTDGAECADSGDGAFIFFRKM